MIYDIKFIVWDGSVSFYVLIP